METPNFMVTGISPGQCASMPLNTNEGPSTVTALCLMEQTTTEYAGIVSEETRHMFEIVNGVILTGLVCLFGIVSNVINIIIFYTQGLTTTMNISFFALAVSDLGSVVTMEWATICFNPLFIESVPQWDTRQVEYLSAAWPHLCFGRITCWITTYITAERCLCIAMPLKVKRIVTPKKTTFIICFVYFVNLAAMIPIYLSSYLDWVHEGNVTVLTMVYGESRLVMEPVAFVLYAFLGTASFPVVVIFTVILVYRLRRQRAWRMKSSSVEKQRTLASQREVQTMSMVVLIAAVLIACYTPGILASLITSFVPEFNLVGGEVNLYVSVWSFVAFLQAVNSSVNVFLYYRMSSKYRQTFLELFHLRRRNDACVGQVPRQSFAVDK